MRRLLRFVIIYGSVPAILALLAMEHFVEWTSQTFTNLVEEVLDLLGDEKDD